LELTIGQDFGWGWGWGWGQVVFGVGVEIVKDKSIEWEKISLFIKNTKVFLNYDSFYWEKVKFLILNPN
jgi:hypothetical protein